MSIALRRVTKADEAALIKLHKESFGAAAWKEFKTSLEQPTTHGWMIEVEGRQAGFILCAMLPGAEAEILTFCIDPALRQKKLGSMLLASALNFAQTQKCGKAFLEVAADNQAARALYEKFGFKLTGKRPDYYQQGRNIGVDAIIYELTSGV